MSDGGFFRAIAIVFIVAGVLALLFRIITGHWLGG
jgi:hypothetical protein